MSLIKAFRSASASSHDRAEKHPFIRSTMNGEITRVEYINYLSLLLPVYSTMESALPAALPSVWKIVDENRIMRSSRLESDISCLRNRYAIPIPTFESNPYANRIKEIVTNEPLRLIAHVYTRYLGDMMGGQMIGRQIRQAFDLSPSETAFYDFGKGEDIRSTAHALRTEIDELGEVHPNEVNTLCQECLLAFELTTKLFDLSLRDRSIAKIS